MIRLNLAWWCRLTTVLRDARDIQEESAFPDVYQRLLTVMAMIHANHVSADSIVKLSVSNTAAVALGNEALAIVKNPERKEPLTAQEVGKLRKAIADYQQILEAELQNVDAYYVKQQGAFSTSILIDRAELALALPDDAAALLGGDIVADLRAGGRCLAFQLPTASGFHVARATEMAIRMLMASLKCSELKDSQRNWGAYIKSLESRDTDESLKPLTHHLQQIKDLHRNPLIHPEQTLTMPEALALWSICISVIGTMMVEIAKRKRADTPEPGT